MGKNDLLTVPELAKHLKLKRVTIYKYLGEGKLPGFKIGTKWRFKRAAVEKWLAQQEEKNSKNL